MINVAKTYPYALTPNKIPVYFDKIANLGPPDKGGVDKWLTQAGLTKDADQRFKNVLRHIGFTDKDGSPTDLWRAYRGHNARSALTEGIRTGYADLFDMYPKAHLASDGELAGFIRGNTALSGNTVKLAVATFKGLVALADFGQAAPAVDRSTPSGSNGTSTETITEDVADVTGGMAKRTQGSHVVVNVSLELTLPETKDPAVYEALFAALAKHILRNDA
jgi:hypothetical protein